MNRMTLLCLTALSMIVCTSPAVSRPWILNCRVLEIVGMPDQWRQVDRIEIDEGRSAITFSVARTLGTKDEVSFTYTNSKDAFSDDRAVFERVGASLRIVALRLATPVAIWVDPLTVRFVGLNAFGVEHVDFVCR
jgi:hypothetical protein